MIASLLTEEWQDFFSQHSTLFIGFSGGLDSTVLLHHLASQPVLLGKLHAVHVHHGLSPNATAWQLHCQQVCEAWGVALSVHQVSLDASANIEEGARDARYRVFSSLLTEDDCLVLGHHCDDQAETLLLQLFRGAGIDGLAAMAQLKPLPKGILARPFLEHTRKALEAYASEHQLTWIEDESNQDCAFSRNFLRQEMMPLLQKKWPGVVKNLVRSASHCQQAQLNLGALAIIDCPELGELKATLDSVPLLHLSHARIANVLRLWLKKSAVRLPSADTLNRLINEVILAPVDATPQVEWGDNVVRRYQQRLYVLKNEPLRRLDDKAWDDFPHPLELDVNAYLQAFLAPEGVKIPLGARVQVRFRQGGELFYWRGQTKQLKKLWQQWKVPPWQRDRVPLLYIDNELAAVIGFAISDRYFGQEAGIIYRIEEAIDGSTFN